jgi:hypothetical protein
MLPAYSATIQRLLWVTPALAVHNFSAVYNCSSVSYPGATVGR